MSTCEHREIFISYGREPEVIEFVKKLKHNLEENQFTVWLDLVDIPSGSDWHGAIGTALHNCRALIAVITNKYINSRYCSSELYTADGDRKKIYPVILEEVDFGASETARGVKYVISGINWTMFRASLDDYTVSLTKLVQGLRGADFAKTSAVHVPTEQLSNLQLSPQPLLNPNPPSAPSVEPHQDFSPVSHQVYPGPTPQSYPPPYQSAAAPASVCGPQTQLVPAPLGFPCGVGFQSPGSGYHVPPVNYIYPPTESYPHIGPHSLGNYPSTAAYHPHGSSTYPSPGTGFYPPPGTGSGTYPGSSTYPPPGFSTYPPPGSSTYPSPGSSTYPPPGTGSSTYPSPGSSTYPPPCTGFYPPPITYHPTGTYQPSSTYAPSPGTYPLDACPPAGHIYPPGTYPSPLPPGSYPQTPIPLSHYTGYQTTVPPLSFGGQPPSYSPVKGEGFAPPTMATPHLEPQRTASDILQSSPLQISPVMSTPSRPTTPVSRCAFKVGTRVEAVDKRFPYFLCVATIMGKKDNSVKIHFDGWGPEYDYECAPDSIFIHPVGWCEKYGWELQKPNGLSWSSWKQYLEDQHATAADESLFSEKQLSPPGSLHFERGMKLEAKDRLNPHLVAVATIADIQDGQLLIHFDGWSDQFDYWSSPDCSDIHPPMWCGKNGISVMPPKDFNGNFKWNEFLATPDVWPSPAYLFTEDQRAGPKVESESSDQPDAPTSDLKGFQVGMKLEAKDRANPNLICVATVTGISDGQLLIHFDGWANNYDYWCGPESLDLHPVGWCNRTGMTLQPPQGTVGDFSWDSYLLSSGSIAAPDSCFMS